MGENNRSNLCKILGVDYDEVFEFRGGKFSVPSYVNLHPSHNRYDVFCDFLCPIYSNPNLTGFVHSSAVLIEMINHPDEIIHHKTFTQEEIDDAKVMAKVLEVDRFYRTKDGFLWGENEHGDEFPIKDATFLTIENGESYTYEQIIGGNN